MDLLTILVLGIGLSMDAFAVSICKGLSLSKHTASKCLIVGTWFGVFQGIMPLTGYLLGSRFEHYVDTFSAWIAFFLLVLIGANMIRESLSEEENTSNAEFGFMLGSVFAFGDRFHRANILARDRSVHDRVVRTNFRT